MVQDQRGGGGGGGGAAIAEDRRGGGGGGGGAPPLLAPGDGPDERGAMDKTRAFMGRKALCPRLAPTRWFSAMKPCRCSIRSAVAGWSDRNTITPGMLPCLACRVRKKATSAFGSYPAALA